MTQWPWTSAQWPWTSFVVYRLSRDQTLYHMWADQNPTNAAKLLTTEWIFAASISVANFVNNQSLFSGRHRSNCTLAHHHHRYSTSLFYIFYLLLHFEVRRQSTTNTKFRTFYSAPSGVTKVGITWCGIMMSPFVTSSKGDDILVILLIGGFNQRHGEALPPQIFLTLKWWRSGSVTMMKRAQLQGKF